MHTAAEIFHVIEDVVKRQVAEPYQGEVSAKLRGLAVRLAGELDSAIAASAEGVQTRIANVIAARSYICKGEVVDAHEYYADCGSSNLIDTESENPFTWRFWLADKETGQAIEGTDFDGIGGPPYESKKGAELHVENVCRAINQYGKDPQWYGFSMRMIREAEGAAV